jgi:hypothetical protein
MAKFLTIGAAVLAAAATVVWAAGPTSLLVKFKLPPSVNTVKPTAIVDGDGNVLFNATTPGQVRIVNPSSPLPSSMRTVQSSSACPFGSGELFDKATSPDGSFSTFAIPAGQVFVITSLAVEGGTGVPSATPGNPVQTALRINNSVYALTIQNSDIGASKSFSLHETFPTGIVVRSGNPICVEAQDVVTAASVGAAGVINGYLTTDN